MCLQHIDVPTAHCHPKTRKRSSEKSKPAKGQELLEDIETVKESMMIFILD